MLKKKYKATFCTRCEVLTRKDQDHAFCNCTTLNLGTRFPNYWIKAHVTISSIHTKVNHYLPFAVKRASDEALEKPVSGEKDA